MSAAWTDNAGNFWLFGGRGYSSRDEVSDLNDVWRYSVANNEWTWMKGDRNDEADARYGQKGSFDDRNTPQGLRGSAAWIDNQGKFWLYGGANRGNLHSDLWKFDPVANQWAWMSGEKTTNHAPRFAEPQIPNENANPGSRFRMTTWTDKENNLWLFGGEGYGNNNSGVLNSMWRYSIEDNTWTFEKGVLSTSPAAEYGTRGEANSNNTPAGTAGGDGWKNELDNLFVFGGQTSQGMVNQLWKFTGCPLAQLGNLKPEKVTLCKGDSQVLTASGGTSYEWRRNGEIITGETSATLTVTEAGTYSVLINRGQCSAPARNESVVTVITQPEGSITPAAAAICEGTITELTATGGTSYEWRRNDVVIAGQTTAKLSVSEPGTYSAVIINGSCRAPASNEAVITQTEPPQGAIIPASATICEGSSQTLTANGGTSYQWLRDGVKIAGETGATLNVDQPGTYSVIISNGECTAEASNQSVISIGNQAGSRYADVLVNANAPTQLTAREGGTSYEWSPATGLDNPTLASPTVTTNTQREYLVRITTDQGCTFTDTVLVKINPEIIVAKVAVPTAFTPNGNGANDRLRPLGNIASIDYFKVYNRWGNMVFQTNQIGDGWDGTYKGSPQPSDTYTWVLVGKSPDGQVIKQTGKTLLIR
jgi:gliding motility-associated-like protein